MTQGGPDVCNMTFMMILPEDFDPDSIMTLEACYDNPQYEIMAIIMDSVQVDHEENLLRLKVLQRAWRGKIRSYAAGSQVRPLIWTNPYTFGAIAFLMNMSTLAPEAEIEEEGPFHWYNIGAQFIADHRLKSMAYIDSANLQDYKDTLYLADGVWLDVYIDDPYSMWEDNPWMNLHADQMDLNLDGISDFGLGTEERESLRHSWLEGYSAFLDSVRTYTKDIRGDSTAFHILTNGQPDTSHFKYLNGRWFEDTNGGFADDDWGQVITRTILLDTSSVIVEPRYQIFKERARYIDVFGNTDLRKMRLTLGTSLLFTDHGTFGVVGDWEARSPIFDKDFTIEDYYDEFAVEDSCYGPWNDAFPKDTLDLENQIVNFDEDTLFTAMHYLGRPLDNVKVYTLHSYQCEAGTCHDIYYREFDHGLVVVHYGSCQVIGDSGEGSEPDSLYPDSEPYRWVYVNTDSMDITDSPESSYHWMEIGGCNWWQDDFWNMYNDSTNTRKDDSGYFRLYLYGDGRILLKEGDGFDPLHDPLGE
jgi:hypothetical protein